MHEHALAGLDRVGVHLELVEAVFERILRRHGVPGQLAGLPGRHEPAPELARERSTRDVAARLGAEYEVGLARRSPLRQPLDGLRERLAIAEQRHDVLEDHAGLREVGNVADLRLEIDRHASSLPRRDPAQCTPQQQLRELLRRLAERAQVLEPLLVPLGVA